MNKNNRSSLLVPSTRPSVTLPPRTTVDNLFTGGVTTTDASPGPMTLVSNFFSINDPDSDFRSFSQLLSGAVSSPEKIADRRLLSGLDMNHEYSDKKLDNSGGGYDGGNVDFQFIDNHRPSGLVVTQPSVFTIPAGVSPASLLDSPGLFSQTQGALGTSHKQALHQVTTQAILPQMHAFGSNIASYQRLRPAKPNHNIKEMPNIPHITVDKPPDDGYNWRKYGQKEVKSSEYPRSYYKCTHPNCPVKKHVERSVEGLVTEIIYKGQHNHQKPQSRRQKDASNGTLSEYEQGSEGQSSNYSQSRDGRSVLSLTMRDQESSQATYEHSGLSDSDEVNTVDERNEDEPHAKRRNTEVRGSEPVSFHRAVTEHRIIVQTTSEIDLLDDGYRWRKYGQKVVKGNSHPRSYYKCTNQGCNVRKHVERAASDPKAVITTYEGKHTHYVPTAKNSSHNIAAATRQPQPPSQAQSLIRRPEYPNRQQPPPTRLLQFKEEQTT